MLMVLNSKLNLCTYLAQETFIKIQMPQSRPLLFIFYLFIFCKVYTVHIFFVVVAEEH